MDTPLVTFSESPDDPFALGRAATAVVDHQGKITGWSHQAETLLGYRPDEVIGRSAIDIFIHDEDRGLAQRAAAECVRARSWFGVLPVRQSDGRRLELGIRASQLVRSGAAEEWFLTGAPADEVTQWEVDRSVLDGLFRRCPIGIAVHAPDLSILRVNRVIARFGGAPAELYRGTRIGDFVIPPDTATVEDGLRRVVETGRPLIFAEQSCRTVIDPDTERYVSVSAFRMEDPSGRVLGVTELVEDVTDRYRARRRLALLNEAGDRIGTTLNLVQTVRELSEVLVPDLADCVTVDLLEPVIHGETAARDTLVPLRRMSLRSVSPEATPWITAENEEIFFTSAAPQTRCLKERRPVLEPEVEMSPEWFPAGERARYQPDVGVHSLMAVPLVARGLVLGVVSMWRTTQPEPFEEDDLRLAAELATRAAVSIDNARQYTHQHEAAVTLQRSLLPVEVPEHPAVEVAHRYLPADVAAGVGGDWFDLIPLSGARVALVVGDVVGHGLPAAATMGRLRTAVHTLAALDLDPEEVLAQLDDLVGRLADEREAVGAASWPDEVIEVIGATCLYAVYDPISRHCAIARAGHPPLAVMTPDGQVALPDLPAGPPLGLGGLPFESIELDLPEGSLLALYTDGLIEAGRRDIDEGLGLLKAALAQPARRLDDICTAVMATVPADHPADDVALLIARTRVLAKEKVASWVLPAEPEAALQARTLTSDQLTQWDLEELVFTTELIVSELVTNAYRYAGGPIELRLIRDQHLICEVSDPSNTAPHLVRARSMDEGGRGLFLVAQLTEHWGTRYTRQGKTVWTEQPLKGLAGSAGLEGLAGVL
ncbi:SpoIIE family protein phosphatase [Streptomyces gobiensis]|uniref:SpoIIE family protein phosphatase n=1 Tax=Streptomyces gobiensis TaxID=2875706 RepID=UPI001E620D0A|nr:SpoIIE family protein phosphatase [Streptomyces gobiensis]UGY91437.1 SpoIIE family protein phosphatase [Streptomyces gobiensis]